VDSKAATVHTHTASQITDFSAAVVAAAPPTTDASLLTSGTLADARLSATVTASLAKADSASQPGHGHSISDVANLATALAEKATTTSVTTVSEALTAESQARLDADEALQAQVTAKSPLTLFFALSGATQEGFNTTYRFTGNFIAGRPEYLSAGDERLYFNESTERWELAFASGDLGYFHLGTAHDPLLLNSGWRRVAGATQSIPHSLTLTAVQVVLSLQGPGNENDPVARAAVELRTEESLGDVALKYAVENDSWQIHDPDNFRSGLGAAPIENPTFEGTASVTDGGDFLTLSAARIQSTFQEGLLDFEETRLAGPGGNVLNWESPGQLSIENRTLKNLGAPAAANDAVRKTDLDTEAQTRATADANLQTQINATQTALDAKLQAPFDQETLIFDDFEKTFPARRNTLWKVSFIVSGQTRTLNLPTGASVRNGDRIGISFTVPANTTVIVKVPRPGNSVTIATLTAGESFVYNATVTLLVGSIPIWTSTSELLGPIRWVKPPATPTSYNDADGVGYSPSDVAYDGAFFYIRAKTPNGSPVWLRSPMASTW
jgi:hypothetical protein